MSREVVQESVSDVGMSRYRESGQCTRGEAQQKKGNETENFTD